MTRSYNMGANYKFTAKLTNRSQRCWKQKYLKLFMVKKKTRGFNSAQNKYEINGTIW